MSDLIVRLDEAIANNDGALAACLAWDAAGDPTLHEALLSRLAVKCGAPGVPGAGYGSYHRGKTLVYVKAFGEPARFDVRLPGVISIRVADTDRRSPRLAAAEAPGARGRWDFLNPLVDEARDVAINKAGKARR